MSMKISLSLIFCIGITLGDSVLPQRKECRLVSRDSAGNPAYCGGFAGAECPNPLTDTCTFYPGADYGPCCLGCKYGDPLGSIRCGGWAGTRCPSGYQCIFDPFIADSEGMCCATSNSKGYNRRL